MDNHEPTVFLVDNEQTCRSIRPLIEGVGLKIQTYANVHDFLDAYDNQPGCLVLEMILPGMSGLRFVSKLSDLGITLPSIIITGHGDVHTAVEAMKAGVRDFIQKPFRDQTLLDAIHKAIELDTELRVGSTLRRTVHAKIDTLTPRELDILDRLLLGNPTKRIAYELGIRHKTADFHRANIFRKMAVSSVVELVLLAQKAGLNDRPAATSRPLMPTGDRVELMPVAV